MTLDTLRAARGNLATLVVTVTVLAASCSQSETGSQAINTIGDVDNGYVATVLDSTVARTDSTILDDRDRSLRRAFVTMSIPPGRDSVVIKPERGDSSSGDGELEFFNLNVNSVALPTPPNLRRILVRRWDRGALEVAMSVQLGRCSRLSLTVVEYAGGRRTRVGLPQRDSDLPNCCSTSLPGAPELGQMNGQDIYLAPPLPPLLGQAVPARTAQEVGERFRHCPTCPEMVDVPTGNFISSAVCMNPATCP